MKNRLLIGLTVLTFSGCMAYAISENSVIAVLAVCVTLAIMPPSIDPAIIWKAKLEPPPPSKPRCFGDWPHYSPSAAAERDCERCPFGMDCFEQTPYRPQTREGNRNV